MEAWAYAWSEDGLLHRIIQSEELVESMWRPTLMSIALDPQIWWPLFPLLLLIVIVALSTGLVWAIRKKASRVDVTMQALALVCYLFTAFVAIANEGGGAASANFHRVPSLLTQVVLMTQLIRVWKRPDARVLRVANLVAWAAILADTALHYMMAKA